MVYSIPDTPAHGSHERTIERRTRRPPPSEPDRGSMVMLDGSDRVTFEWRGGEGLPGRAPSCRTASVRRPRPHVRPRLYVSRRGFDRREVVLPSACERGVV